MRPIPVRSPRAACLVAKPPEPSSLCFLRGTNLQLRVAPISVNRQTGRMRSTSRLGETMTTEPLASILDPITLGLIEGLSCLSNASDLLLDGHTVSESSVRHWVQGAHDDLAALPNDAQPRDLCKELRSMLSAMETRAENADHLVTPASLDAIHSRVAMILRQRRATGRLGNRNPLSEGRS